ncbi:hypothetical protein TNCV_1860511 [Trichonephila clavipes]|nr:hypothetical protein TNCV_1860511 [Trichonephila clavipes]
MTLSQPVEDIFIHATSTAIHNYESAASAIFCARTYLPIMSHIYWLGLISGDLSGQILRLELPRLLLKLNAKDFVW